MNLRGRCKKNAKEYLTEGKVYMLILVKQGLYNKDDSVYHIKWDTSVSDPIINYSTILDYFDLLPMSLNPNSRTL